MIAEQAICEYRVHLELHGSRRRPAPGLVDVGELVSLILGARRRTYRSEVRGVVIVARPHAVLSLDGATVVVRARLGGGLKPSLYDRAYLEAAALAVGVESAVLAFVAAESVERLREALLKLKSSPRPWRGSGWAVSTWLFSRSEALERLDRLLAYWRGERDPVPRPSPAKCASCPVAGVCPHAARGLE